MKHALLLVLVVFAATASAEPITVRVTELAGGIAYVTPGRAAGLVPNTRVRIRGRDFIVVEATEKTASLRADAGALSVGETGTANVDRAAAAAVQRLAKPRPPEAFVGQWPDAVHPAETQSPSVVPLGAARAPGHAHVTVIGHGYAVGSKDHALAGDGELRAITSFDVLDDRPLAADLDVAGRTFASGYDRGTHTPLYIRAAELRYGDAYDPRFALGRLRFAASSIGMLDGGRVAAHFGDFELAAFGGLVPDPVSGKPTTDASRFGSELVFDDRQARWQPRLAVVASGSTWQGRLDERRLSVVASANHESTWVDGWAEAQNFDSGNPWAANTVEITGAGGALEWREHGTHAGFDVSYLRPERSLRLAAVLPAEWLCPTPSCKDSWTTASASAGVRAGRWSLDAVGTIGDAHGAYSGLDSSGYVRGEVRADTLRVIAGGSGGYASFASWIGGEVGLGGAIGRRVDALVTYRPELLDYRAGMGPAWIHSLVAEGHWAVSPTLDLAGSTIATTGFDRDAVALLATFIWRPLP